MVKGEVYMKKNSVLLLLVIILFINGCSSSSEKTKDASSNNKSSLTDMKDDSNEAESIENTINTTGSNTVTKDEQARMVIYRAEVYVEVKNVDVFNKNILQQLSADKGYIVKKSFTEVDENDSKEGNIELRIPQAMFHSFLDNIARMKDVRVTSQHVEGEDVTEEYVDIASRLKAKQAVEIRLYEFMNKATKTNDLLQISKDLGAVQADIESMKGRMEFLSKQSAMSYINIMVSDKSIKIPNINEESLNTWGKIKHEFMESIQVLLAFSSSLLVFFVGNSLLLIVIALVGWGLWFLIKRYVKKHKK